MLMALFLFSCTKSVPLPKLPVVVYDAKAVATAEKIIKPPADALYYDQAFVVELYQIYRDRVPTSDELLSWSNALSQGASREGIFRSIILGVDYLGRSEGETKLSDDLKSFLGKLHPFLEYGDSRYIFNIFWIVSNRTERALDIFDAFPYDDALKWYAHLSSMLAEYSDILQLPVRINKHPYFHYAWAKELPIQYVKSEIIIKLSKIMFALNQK
jgi:hypothetical protein